MLVFGWISNLPIVLLRSVMEHILRINGGCIISVGLNLAHGFINSVDLYSSIYNFAAVLLVLHHSFVSFLSSVTVEQYNAIEDL